MKHIQIRGKDSTYYIFPQLPGFTVDEDHISGKTFIGFRYPDGKRYFIRHITKHNLQFPLMSILMHQESLIQGQPGFFLGSVEIIQQNEHLFLVRDFEEGITLKSIFRSHTFGTTKKHIHVLKLFRSILESVDAFHHQEIIHCNLRPSCILIRQNIGKIDLQSPGAIISDFSLAKTVHFDPPKNSVFPVTYMYNAPEVLLNKHHLKSPASDFYSLGIILYEMLMGHHPHRVKHPKIVGDMHLSSPIRSFKGIHSSIEKIILKATERILFEKSLHSYSANEIETMLKKGVKLRYSTAQDFISDIDHVLVELSSYNPIVSAHQKKDNHLHPVVFFDEMCNLCTSALHFMIKRDKRKILRYTGLNSFSRQKYQIPESISISNGSVMLIENGKIYDRSDAFIRIFQHFGGWYNIVVILKLIPRFLRDTVYNLIARKRYQWWGKRTECYVPPLYEKFLFDDLYSHSDRIAE